MKNSIKIINSIKKNPDQILSNWLQNERGGSILKNYHITRKFFIEEFGYNIIDYLAEVFRGKKKPGGRPAMMKFLFFVNNKFKIHDLFIFYGGLQKSIVNFVKESNDYDTDFVEKINLILDENFEGMINKYSSIYYLELSKSKERLEKLNSEIKKQSKSLNEYKDALDAALIISRTDPKLIITSVNELFCEASGYKEEELIGINISLMDDPEMPIEFIKNIHLKINNKKTWKGIMKNKSKDGSGYWVKTIIIPLLNNKGNIKEFLFLETKINEDEKNRLELEKSYEELKNFDKIKDRFLGITSHEMRTPLTVIKGYSSLLSEGSCGKVNAQQKEFLDKIFKNSGMLISLVDNMLDVTKLKSGKLDLVISKVDINNMVNSLIKEFSVLYKEKKLTIDFENKLDFDGIIETDQDKFKQVLINLLTNACKFTLDKGSVKVIAQKSDISNNDIIITVKDNGIGIPEDKQETIFDEFNQIDNYLQREHQGTGLGLLIVKNIVNQLEGKVWVESEEGKGSSFMFTINTNYKSGKQKKF